MMFDLASNNLRIGVHGGADSGGGLAGVVEGFLSFIEGFLVLSPAQMFARAMPGIASMDNLHPLFVHFPIALLSLFFLLDIAGSVSGKTDWRRAAGWFLYCGAVFAGLTVATGLVAAASVAHGGDVHEIMEHHEHLGISVFLLASVLVVWRLLVKGSISGATNTLYLLFAAILTGLLLFAADLGGLMVFKYGVAVEPVAEINRGKVAAHQHGQEGVVDGHDRHDDVDEQLSDAPEHHHDHSH